PHPSLQVSPVVRLHVFTRELVPNVAYPRGRSLSEVEIHLLDANDNNPTFKPSGTYHFNLSRTALPGAIVGQVLAEDADDGVNGMVTYSLEPSKDVVPFVVDPQYGTVKVGPAVTFSREKTEYTIFLRAKDNPKNPSEMRTNVAVIHVAVWERPLVTFKLGSPSSLKLTLA
ncbi:unnamed protein product, partial [Cyprideis torosa]